MKGGKALERNLVTTTTALTLFALVLIQRFAGLEKPFSTEEVAAITGGVIAVARSLQGWFRLRGWLPG